jgi:LPXTG-motif cell wall-anchored protein
MKKLICLILVLVMCLSLAVSASAFIESPNGTPGGDNDGNTEGGAPQTGDTNNLMLWTGIMVAAVVGVGAVVLTYRKKFANQ